MAVDIKMPLDIPKRKSNTVKLKRVGESKRVDLPTKLQLNLVIPEHISLLQDGLKLSLLMPYSQAFKVGQ